jgi:vacuolar-type H+-ATPase subunit E/Vma4
MIRKMAFGFGLLAAVTFAVGCDAGSSAAKKAETGAREAKGAAGTAEKAADQAKEAAKEAKEAAKEASHSAVEAGKSAVEKGKDMTKEAADKLKEGVVKPVSDFLPKAEEKLKGLSGDAATKGKEKLEAVKKLIEEFKAAPSEKLGEMKDKVIAAVKELAKTAGLEAPKFAG